MYFEDTDAGGLAYHASYIRWFERGRSDFLRLAGLNHTAMMAPPSGEPHAIVVRRLTADYLKPGRLDDLLEIRTEPMALGATSLTLRQEAARGADILCRAEVMCVLISLSGRPLRIRATLPAHVVAALDAEPRDAAD
ncbi:MAG: YbgC/FadM family acyl-CoA thioesterase [Hyphomicrobiales bacterium]|nr:YbgC/FadM family acyl-CoA thioesterase [Hyphomicrobiales bacterium]